jgi:hypothetical protein
LSASLGNVDGGKDEWEEGKQGTADANENQEEFGGDGETYHKQANHTGTLQGFAADEISSKARKCDQGKAGEQQGIANGGNDMTRGELGLHLGILLV